MTTETSSTNPVPPTNMRDVSAPFWEGAKQHRLVLQRSVTTGEYIYFPRVVSPFAGEDQLEWVELSGKGQVVACTVVHRPHSAELQAVAPYCMAIVELDEGARMTTNIVGCAPESVFVGMPVVAEFQDDASGRTLVKFRPAE